MRRGSLMSDVEWMARGRKGGTDRIWAIPAETAGNGKDNV